MTDKVLAVQQTADNDIDTMSLGRLLAQSGYFADAKDAAQAVVKVLAGRELGLGPVASMTGVYIVKGKPSLSANLLAGVLKRSGKYTFRVVKHDDAQCEIAFFERQDGKWEEIGRSAFTAADARRAGTQNMERFPRNMLYARAMTNGIRWYCPDVFAGGIYTPEEMGAPVDGDGNVIDAPAVVVTERPAPSVQPAASAPAPEAPNKPKPNGNSNGNGQHPQDAERDKLRTWFAELKRSAERLNVPMPTLGKNWTNDELKQALERFANAVTKAAGTVVAMHPKGVIDLDETPEQTIAQAIRLLDADAEQAALNGSGPEG